VSWIARHTRSRVALHHEGRFDFMGSFADEIEAEKAYNASTLALAGEFAA
jgi:hypothetical protein